MNDAVAEPVLDQLFLSARSRNGWTPDPVSDDLIRRIYDVAKWGPTAANGNPARFVFVTSDEAKDRLVALASGNNKAKIKAAPVTVIVGYDLDFPETLRQAVPARPEHEGLLHRPGRRRDRRRCATARCRAAYLMIAARALGLDCGPMSGFDNAGVDAAFFAGTRIKIELHLLARPRHRREPLPPPAPSRLRRSVRDRLRPRGAAIDRPRPRHLPGRLFGGCARDGDLVAARSEAHDARPPGTARADGPRGDAGAGLAFADLDRVGVTVGPGSFTGLRVGLAFAKGLGVALDRPVRRRRDPGGAGIRSCAGVKRPPIDAGAGNLYLQIFEDRRGADRARHPEPRRRRRAADRGLRRRDSLSDPARRCCARAPERD